MTHNFINLTSSHLHRAATQSFLHTDHKLLILSAPTPRLFEEVVIQQHTHIVHFLHIPISYPIMVWTRLKFVMGIYKDFQFHMPSSTACHSSDVALTSVSQCVYVWNEAFYSVFHFEEVEELITINLYRHYQGLLPTVLPALVVPAS